VLFDQHFDLIGHQWNAPLPLRFVLVSNANLLHATPPKPHKAM